MDVPDVYVEKSRGLLLFKVSDVIKTFDAVLEFVDVVALPLRLPVTFPVKAPAKELDVSIPVLGVYDSDKGVVSTYSGRGPVPVVIFI
jgi:hypothetical protein